MQALTVGNPISQLPVIQTLVSPSYYPPFWKVLLLLVCQPQKPALCLYAPKENNEAANLVGNVANLFSQSTRWLASNSGALAPNGSANKNPTGSVNI